MEDSTEAKLARLTRLTRWLCVAVAALALMVVLLSFEVLHPSQIALRGAGGSVVLTSEGLRLERGGALIELTTAQRMPTLLLRSEPPSPGASELMLSVATNEANATLRAGPKFVQLLTGEATNVSASDGVHSALLIPPERH
jgi:hypothetical protein